ncbi:hypothetical protein K1719_034427 [Acacia pycnantha]|nr:hypothetical protein K1719_034427 [Acacia pycnantha]
MTSSTARGLLSLTKLTIYDCKVIEEIVNCDEGDDGEIAFMKLERLELHRLSNLTSFCKGDHSFRFPLMRTIFVVECPKMKTFSKGVLSTPMLRTVRMTWERETYSKGVLSTPMLRTVRMTWERDGEWHWHGDLNTTIGKNFKGTNAEESLDF